MTHIAAFLTFILDSCTSFFWCFADKYQKKRSLTHFTTHPPRHLIYSSFPFSLLLCSFTFSRRTDGRKAAWHSFLMVQLIGRGASSWFMVSPLHSGATGAQFFFLGPGSMLPHWGGKNGRGSPTPTAKMHTGPRAWPWTENHQLLPPPPWNLYFPSKIKLSHGQISAQPPLPPCSLLHIQKVQDTTNLEPQDHLFFLAQKKNPRV